jgi:hypothetical protein
MRAAHLALAVALLTALAGCSKGPQGDAGPPGLKARKAMLGKWGLLDRPVPPALKGKKARPVRRARA